MIRATHTLRYTAALLVQFRATLLSLAGLVVFGAIVFCLSPVAPSWHAAAYASWMALFGEPIFSNTEQWYIELLVALYPLFGALLIGEGIVRFGMLMVSRRQGDAAWVRIVTSTQRNHIVVCGLGHLGFRVIEALRQRGATVVAIEKNPDARHLQKARTLNVMTIVADMKDDDALKDAGIEHAKAVVIATNDDLANIEVALDSRRLNPSIKIFMRQYDQQIAGKLSAAFEINHAFSSAALAAPLLAEQVLGMDTLAQFSLDGKSFLTRETTADRNETIALLEQREPLRVLLTEKDGAWLPVRPTDAVNPGQKLVVTLLA